MYRTLLLVGVALWGLPLMTAAGAMAPAFTVGQLDPEATGTFDNGTFEPTPPESLKDLLDPTKSATAWSAGSVNNWKGRQFQYRLAFSKPVAIGTMLVSVYDKYAKNHVFHTLKPDAPYPGDPENSEHWEEIKTTVRTGYHQHTFPAGFKTRALMFSEIRPIHPSRVHYWHLLKARLFNVTPHCMGQGQQSYGAWWPMDIPHGREWHGAGSVGEDPSVHRPPVSPIDPSWFILSRKEGLRPAAMRFGSNIGDYRLYAFRGDDKENPALADESKWERVPHTVVDERGLGGSAKSISRLMVMDKTVESRAFRVLLRETQPKNSKIAIVHEWTIWEDLGNAPVPGAPPKRPPPPVRFGYEIAEDGMAAVVIDDVKEGTRLRNLVAQVERTAGQNDEAWDLKDRHGRYIEPGAYTLRGISAPPLELRYGHTFYPNVEMHSPGSRPWGGRRQDGWLGNHNNNTGLAIVGDKLFIGTGGTEGGHGILACTLDGQKLWGTSAGCGEMFADDKTVFFHRGSSISGLDAETYRWTGSISYSDAARRGDLVGMAARDSKLYLAFHSVPPYFDKAVTSRGVDMDACLPLLRTNYDPPGRDHLVPADQKQDFRRLFRLEGRPAGLGDKGSLEMIPSTDWASHKQHIVLAFKEPTPLGSVVYPRLAHTNYSMQIAVHKPDAEWPPNPKRKADWVPLDDSGPQHAWEVLAAPKNTSTRALKITFAKAGQDELLDDFDTSMREGGEVDTDLGGGDDTLNTLLGGSRWRAEIEGMMLLRRRFRNVFSSAEVTVNSGNLNRKTGEWIGAPTELISSGAPGIYTMQWNKKQNLVGLAIQEIDGMWTDVDVYTGPDDGSIDMNEPVGRNWRRVARYTQKPRDGGANSLRSNGKARYIEGFVNFGSETETRAVRLRIVRQWPYGALRRHDRGGSEVNHKRCAVYGVAPLEYVRGEPPLPKTVAQRISIYDWETKEVIKDLPSKVTGAMTFHPNGTLYANASGAIVPIDISGDKAIEGEPLVPFGVLKSAHSIAFDSGGNLVAYDHAGDRRQAYVFNDKGEKIHTIGKAGHPKPGPWDPSYIIDAFSMAVSQRGDVYFNYGYDNPRRTVHFKTDGTFVQEFLGGTYYGGGCTLDRYDSSLGFYMDMIFKIDWEKHQSRLHAMKAFEIAETTMWSRPTRTHTAAVMVNGRKYHVSIPLVIRPVNSGASVLLYDEETMTHRLVASVGSCMWGNTFSQPEFVELLKGQSPGSFKHIFADLNGDGIMQTNEVQISPMGEFSRLGRFQRDLSIMGGTYRYEVKEFLEDGTPIYHEVRVPEPGGFFRFNNGNYFSFAGDALHGNGYNLCVDPEGNEVWTYPASFDVSGLYIPPAIPGRADNQFAICGHETEERGDLGEFIVIHANTGQWNLWTADGLLAGRVLRHARDPKARRLGADFTPGANMNYLTAGQEHFHGFFCKTLDDGKYKVVMGDDGGTIIEVLGLDKYKRFSKTIEVTPEMLKKTRRWEADYIKQNLYARTPTVESVRKTPIVNGAVAPGEWGENFSAAGHAARFATAYNSSTIFLCWQVLRQGPFENGGDDFRRFFKTGGGVDIKIQTDPKADPDRIVPAKGDVRLLLTMAGDKPKAVLYRPVAPDAPESDAWSTSTTAGGTVTFDQVVELDDVRIAHRGDGVTYTVEASVPMEALGLQITDGSALKFDWGVLATEEGNETTARTYWANEMAVGVTDEPTEARLHPDLWGFIRFAGVEKTLMEKISGDNTDDLKKQDVDDIFDDLEEDM